MMEPVYDVDGIQIWHGEALNVLTTMDSRKFAAVITDPPYSSGGAYRSDRNADPTQKYRGWSQDHLGNSHAPKSESSTFTGDSRDQRSFLLWSSLWMAQTVRVSVANAQSFTFTDWRQLPTMTDSVQSGGWVWRGLLVWDKGIGRPMKGRFRNHLEYLVWASNGPMPDPDDVYPSTLLRHSPPTGKNRVHLTEKPVSIFAELLTVCPPGPVLDPFMGSGPLARACRDVGRDYVGIELDDRHIDSAIDRLRQTTLDLNQ